MAVWAYTLNFTVYQYISGIPENCRTSMQCKGSAWLDLPYAALMLDRRTQLHYQNEYSDCQVVYLSYVQFLSTLDVDESLMSQSSIMLDISEVISVSTFVL